MGLPLFVGYYTVHDDFNGKIGFVPGFRSPKNGPYWGNAPQSDFGDGWVV